MHRCVFFVLFFVFQNSALLLWGELFDPAVLYLTWFRQPESTMVIQWVDESTRNIEDVVAYQKDVHQEVDSLAKTSWQIGRGRHYFLPNDKKYTLHRVELTQLVPNTIYRFKIGLNGKEYKFRTMPQSLSTPIRFAVGGDMYHDAIEFVRETNRQVAKYSPLFVLAGGDLAYASGGLMPRVQTMDRWMTWLKAWKEDMVSSEGCLIPIIAAIGNHDVSGGFGQTPAKAAIFYSLFREEKSTAYEVLDFDSYMSIVILDSGHTTPISRQSAWLEGVLSKRTAIPNTFALYHVPAYPAFRKLSNKTSAAIRKFWVPLFEKYHLDIAFENHDHLYKRTYPLLKGRLNPNGVIYMGDGSWGVEQPRQVRRGLSYLAKASSSRHFIVVTLQEKERYIQAIDSQGNILDEIKQKIN